MSKRFQMKSNDSEILTAKQKAVIPYLLSARSLEAACREARVSKSTVYEYLKIPAFTAELQRLREEITRDALNRLKTGFGQAVETLLGLIQDKTKGIRLRACEKVIDIFLRLREMEEIEARLRRIEETLDQRKP